MEIHYRNVSCIWKKITFDSLKLKNSEPPMHQQPINLPVSSVINTTTHTNNVKQKSLLRKSRQTPAPFELNVPTSLDPTQNRLPQFGDDLSKTFGSVSGSPLVTDKSNVMKTNFLEDFKLVSSFVFFFYLFYLFSVFYLHYRISNDFFFQLAKFSQDFVYQKLTNF